MPDSMMMPPVGSMAVVSGNKIAMVAAGPRPGRMPITVPRKQPTTHQNKFCHCMATEKPVSKPSKPAMSDSGPDANRQLNFEQQTENHKERQRHQQARKQ